MPYYLAEIRLNKRSKNVRMERKMGKQLIKHLVITLLIFTLISALIMIVPVAVGSDDSGQSEIIADLEDLHEHVSNTTKLPNNAFNNSRAAEGQRNALCNKIQAVIHQIEAGAYKGAVNKLQNDIENAIGNWINDPWKSELIEEVEGIIEKIRDKEPPVIVDVWREPETPAYNETVTVKANVTDERSGVKTVILSYSIDMIRWVNVTMDLVEGLYVGEIPAFPYDTTVYYKIYAYDKAGNLATAEPYSYTVTDPYDPVIGVPTWEPEEPFADEEVKVSVLVSEPVNASGIKNVTLWYRTDSEWQSIEMELKKGKWTATIPGQSAGVNVTFYIESYDNAGNSVMTPTYYYTVKAPPPGRRPVAVFTYSPLTPYTGEAVIFDARASYDPDGYIVSYFWDFGDDSTGTGNITTHSYVDNGVYIVTLKVTDNDTLSDTFSADVTVLNRPPIALFTENATTVLTGETIHFDASGSRDPDGSIVSYFWNFGDGTNATGVTTTHSYADNGTYTVTLTVTDNDGATDSANATKIVGNKSPVALFTESAESVLTGQTISFNAGSSYDPDGTIASYSWDFGDGASATGVTVNHAYEDDGIYTVTLTVTDDDGATASTNANKTVSNRPPVALFTENETTVLTGETIRFNASGSYDPDGSIVRYLWDFGDNTTEIYKGENLTAIATHTYAKARNYTVTLTVTDDDGASSSLSAEKTVKARPGLPWALFAVVGLGIAALVATVIYLWYRRRKKRGAASAAASPPRPETKPVVTLYVPSGVLAGYQEERR